MTLKSFVFFFNVYLLEGFFFRKGRELESVTAQNQDTGPYFLADSWKFEMEWLLQMEIVNKEKHHLEYKCLRVNVKD